MNDLSNPKQQRIKRRHTRSDHFVLLNMRCQRVQKKASETWMRRTHTLRIIHQVSPPSVMARFVCFFLSRLYSAIWNSKTRLLKVLYVRVGCLPNPCSETTNTSSQHRSAGVVCYQTFKLIGKNNFLISALV